MMTFLWAWLVGACIGSFISAFSYRYPRGLDWVKRRSFCPSCESPLKAASLVPVFSWIVQAGKCRHCRINIPLRYPLLELGCGALAVWHLWLWPMGGGFWPIGLLVLLLAWVLVAESLIDLEFTILPDALQLITLGIGLVYVAVNPHQPGWVDGVIGMGAGLGMGLLLHYGYFWLRNHHGLGFGDVKLFAIAGLWMGWQGLPVFFFMAGLFGVVFGLLWRMATGSRYFPFGPALAAAWLAVLWMQAKGMLTFVY
jgi:leader peptidase (prepilin peptidase)/N-methyltransferase